jgi:hypothetical protein
MDQEDGQTVSLSKVAGSLTLTSEAGMCRRGRTMPNLLLQSANSDWTIETKLSGSRIPSQPENAGILAWQDDHNFVKLMFRPSLRRTEGGHRFLRINQVPST